MIGYLACGENKFEIQKQEAMKMSDKVTKSAATNFYRRIYTSLTTTET